MQLVDDKAGCCFTLLVVVVATVGVRTAAVPPHPLQDWLVDCSLRVGTARLAARHV